MALISAKTDTHLFVWIGTDIRFGAVDVRHRGQHQAFEQSLAADKKVLRMENRFIHIAATKRNLLIKNSAQINKRTRKNRNYQANGK